jgi:hypothetical protein
VVMALMLAGIAWGQSGKAVGELAKYARADRKKLLYDSAKEKAPNGLVS